MQRYTVYFIWKLLYMFRVVSPPIRQVAVTVWQIPDAVDTVVCAPDDGWRYHPKHLEQFPDKINCVTLHLVGYILECSSLVISIIISHWVFAHVSVHEGPSSSNQYRNYSTKFSTSVNQESCLGGTVYQDHSPLTSQLFYKELHKFLLLDSFTPC